MPGGARARPGQAGREGVAVVVALQRKKTRGPGPSSLESKNRKKRKENPRGNQRRTLAVRVSAVRGQQVAAAGAGRGSLVSPRAAQDAGFEHWRSGFDHV